MNKIISSDREEIMSSMTPKRDFIFKKLFGTVGKERLVKDFLEAILDIKIKSLINTYESKYDYSIQN